MAPAQPSPAADGLARRRLSALETTPLLGDLEDTAIPPTAIDDADDGQSGQDGGPADKDRIPRTQVALLCFARLIEPIAFFSIFPYINQMVKDNGGLADTDVGFYSGLIESLFSLTQAIVMLGWGRAADRFGRKPVLVMSLIGMSGSVALFGLARSIPQMIAFRCLAGLFSGTIVTIRTMLSEHSTAATQARVFSWFAFSGNLGIFLGPLLGGALADPLGTVTAGGGSSVLGKAPFLVTYPYALPGFVVSGMGMVAAVTCAVLVKETLVRPPSHSGHANGHTNGRADSHANEHAREEQAGTPAPALPSPIRSLLAAPGVASVLSCYGYVMVLAFSYTAISPVFWFTPVPLGGYGFTSLQISLMMGVTGAAQALWLLVVFPPLQHRIGTNGVMRWCAYLYGPFFAICPLLTLLRRPGPDSVWNTVFWVVAPPLLAVGVGVSMCFTAVQLAVNDVSPSPQQLGTLNALALTGVSGIRAVMPALFTTLFAIGARTQWLWGEAIWVLMVALGLGYVVLARRLPDYDELRKQREEAAEAEETTR